MRRILFISAIAVFSLLSFVGCDDENNFLGDDNKPTTEEIAIVLDSDSLLLYVGDVDTLIATVKNGNKNVDYKVAWLSDDAQVAEVDSNGVVTALSVGTAVITVKYKDVIYTCKVVVTERPIEYEYVDLGLSVNWAIFNVGATKVEEYGDHFAWGETETKTDYTWSTYKWCNGSNKTMTKYCNNSDYGNNGFTDAKTTIDPEDDVAHVKWGGSWRMPTKDELEELRLNCTWTWTTLNGANGYLVKSKKTGYTDRSIFLPAAGYRGVASQDYVGLNGGYWTSSLVTFSPYDAHGLDFFSSDVFASAGERFLGLSVRPVRP